MTETYLYIFYLPLSFVPAPLEKFVFQFLAALVSVGRSSFSQLFCS